MWAVVGFPLTDSFTTPSWKMPMVAKMSRTDLSMGLRPSAIKATVIRCQAARPFSIELLSRQNFDLQNLSATRSMCIGRASAHFWDLQMSRMFSMTAWRVREYSSLSSLSRQSAP